MRFEATTPNSSSEERSKEHRSPAHFMCDSVLTSFPRQCISLKSLAGELRFHVSLYGPTIDLHSLPRDFCRWVNGGIAFRSFERCSERKYLLMQNQPRVASAKNSQAGEVLEKTLQSHGPNSSAHRIGILMSQTGRFLECIKCRLSFAFPAGAHYDTIAKQFERHLCESTISRREDPKTGS
jgi:hypothetical protein